MDITIKQATSENVQDLSTIAQLTFPLAGPADSCPMEMSDYIQSHLNESVFQQLVKNDDLFIGCAHSGTELAGFIVLKYDSNHPNNEDAGRCAELQRLYVLKAFHGTSISKLLVSETLKNCRVKGIDTVWLNVYSENSRAKKFYAKFGFQKTGTTFFKMGSETHLDHVMTANIS